MRKVSSYRAVWLGVVAMSMILNGSAMAHETPAPIPPTEVVASVKVTYRIFTQRGESGPYVDVRVCASWMDIKRLDGRLKHEFPGRLIKRSPISSEKMDEDQIVQRYDECGCGTALSAETVKNFLAAQTCRP